MLKINQQNLCFIESNQIAQAPCLDILEATIVLKKLANSWSKRAQVRHKNSNVNLEFIDEAEDFLVDLLPFKNHPDFHQLSEEMKKKVLSCGWIIYNQKTVTIETKLVNPVCVNILSEMVPGVSDSVCKQIVSETMVDESYHVLLVMNAIGITNQRRSISLRDLNFNLIKNMKFLQSQYPYQWQKILIQLATAIVSEIFISDYLKLLSDNEKIQPINRLTAKIHRDDELAHSNIFKNLTKCIYASLSKSEKEFFAEILAKPVRWFADCELDVWQTVFDQIGFKNASKMIRDCKHVDLKCLNNIDYSGLISLAEEIGIIDISVGLDSFHREGLLN